MSVLQKSLLPQPIITNLTSMTFVRVGPIMIRSPSTVGRCISSTLSGTIPLVTSLYQLSLSTILAVHTLMWLSSTQT